MVLTLNQKNVIWDNVLEAVKNQINDRHLFDSFIADTKIYKIEGIDHFPFTFVECSNIECADILGKWYIFDK